jgi:hypothetical protein
VAGTIRLCGEATSKVRSRCSHSARSSQTRLGLHVIGLSWLSGPAPCSGQFESGPSSTPAGSRSSVTDRWAIEWQVQPSSIASAVPGSGNNDDGIGTVRGGMARSCVPVFILDMPMTAEFALSAAAPTTCSGKPSLSAPGDATPICCAGPRALSPPLCPREHRSFRAGDARLFQCQSACTDPLCFRR